MHTTSVELVFGNLVGAHHVDDAIIQLLKTWCPAYLHEVARQSGEPFERLEPFRSYRISTEMEKMPEDQTPGVIIVNQGLAETPDRAGASKMTQSPYRSGYPFAARWTYQIGVICSAKGKKQEAGPRALRRARMYILAVRGAMIQQRDDKEVIGMVDWLNEEYDGLDSASDRTICLAHDTFNIECYDVVSWGTGPTTPAEVEPPPPDSETWPQADDADFGIIKVPQDQDPKEYEE